MSVFDVSKNNRGNDQVGIYMSYKTFDEYLRQAQVEALQGPYSEGIATAVKVGREAERIRMTSIVEKFKDSEGYVNMKVSDFLNFINEA